jgi:molybdate transport system substrate-binding protein
VGCADNSRADAVAGQRVLFLVVTSLYGLNDSQSWRGLPGAHMMSLSSTAQSLVLMLLAFGTADAAELKVLSTHAALEVLDGVTPEFEKSTSNKLTFNYDPALVIKQQIENGVQFDVALITRGALDDLATNKLIDPQTITDLAKSGLGIAVRRGLPKPDISSVAAFKTALLKAKSIVRSTDGTSGRYFAALTERLGIADAIRSKVKLGPSGRVAELVERGEAEMAVQQISELLPVAGVEFVGPFPPEIQLYTTFAVGVSLHSVNPDAARALVHLLTSPASAAVFIHSGLQPITQPGR